MAKKILVLMMILIVMISNFAIAENSFSDTPMSTTNQTVNQQTFTTAGNQSSQITGAASSPISQITNINVDKTIDEAGTQVSNLAEVVLRQVADKSTPICALLLIYGAVLYFIMGIRNLYRKRQGMLMMWGSLTFWVIAQVAYVVFWLLGTKL